VRTRPMIRAFLFWCVEFRGLRENPASKIKPRQVLQKPPTVYSEKDISATTSRRRNISTKSRAGTAWNTDSAGTYSISD
jgi:hypothetical protein